MTALEALNQKRAEVVGDIEALKASVSAAGRSEFNVEESEKLSGLINQAEHLSNQIDLHKKTEQLTASMSVAQPRVTEPVMTSTVAARPTFSGGTQVSAGFANHGFAKGFSEFLGAVRNAAFGRVDPRLSNAVTTYGAEGVGPDGGFAVPPEYAAQITSTVTGEDSLLAKFNPIMTLAIRSSCPPTRPPRTAPPASTPSGSPRPAATPTGSRSCARPRSR